MDDLQKSLSIQKSAEVLAEIEEVTLLLNSNPVPRARELVDDANKKHQVKQYKLALDSHQTALQVLKSAAETEEVSILRNEIQTSINFVGIEVSYEQGNYELTVE